MSRINTVDFNLVRGDDLTKTLTFRNKTTTAPIDVSAWTFAGQVRTDPDAVDPPSAAFAFDLTGAAVGVVTASIPAADTANMSARFYFYDIQTIADGLTRTRISGRINITKDATRA